ncbi:hypothetical protein VFPFJ_04045 [Purpureocillium lilacinum]|uniref:Uncharacterized protein n=1 Tax=Purpureocillium lilacinum TaxID=33203 RepID=A0A179GWC5_PURLI|nr:hypothetical protein VFPFJ_04045 [Purpureocillium lilacinum]OAQ82267.1 hypothetical protein VFPBJ_04851 [Purpureocillium lilacinum]OAQ92305.1 hypothetical protein VFPFJ_04045 [Purpureocillium lilacinum]
MLGGPCAMHCAVPCVDFIGEVSAVSTGAPDGRPLSSVLRSVCRPQVLARDWDTLQGCTKTEGAHVLAFLLLLTAAANGQSRREFTRAATAFPALRQDKPTFWEGRGGAITAMINTGATANPSRRAAPGHNVSLTRLRAMLAPAFGNVELTYTETRRPL